MSLNYHVVYPGGQVQIWRCSVDPGDPLADFTAVEALERWLLAKAGSWEPWEVSDLKTQERQNPKSEAVPCGRQTQGKLWMQRKDDLKMESQNKGWVGRPWHCKVCCEGMRITGNLFTCSLGVRIALVDCVGADF